MRAYMLDTRAPVYGCVHMPKMCVIESRGECMSVRREEWLDSYVSSDWQIGGGFTRHRKYELRQLPLHGTRTLVDALRTGLHGGRGLHSAPVQRRSGSGAKRQQWSKADDHVLQADLLAA